MYDRIHRVLDGELPRERLAGSEAEELDAFEEAIGGALATMAREPAPDVAGEVLRRIEALPERSPAGAGPIEALRRAFDWFWTPRPITLSLRPAHALAAVALLALLPAVRMAARGGPVPGGQLVVAAGPEAPRVFVHFRLDAPGARQVALAGDFTGWEPEHALYETAPGVWSVVVALEPGVHDYNFVVDGERWVPDPLAPRVDDGFGGVNSRLAVLSPVSGRAS